VILLLFVTFSRSRIAFSLLYLFPSPGCSFSMACSLFSRSCCFSLCLSFLCRRSRFLSEDVRSSLPITSPLGRSVTMEHNINVVILGNKVQCQRIFNNNVYIFRLYESEVNTNVCLCHLGHVRKIKIQSLQTSTPDRKGKLLALNSPFRGVSTRYLITCVYHFPVYSSTSHLTKGKI